MAVDNTKAISQFSKKGFLEFTALENHDDTHKIYNKIYKSRPFDHKLFLTQEEWESSNKSHKNTNPRAGRNIMESLQGDLVFVEQNPQLLELLSQLLGKDFRWAFKKIVCRIALDSLPEWLRHMIGKKPANTLNAFIRPEYRDISYYLENDLHQDIQDYPRLPSHLKEHRVLSLYVHLSDIAAEDAPLYLLPETHHFGATLYQHNIHKINNGLWKYTDDKGRTMDTYLHPILGKAGHVAIWHSCLIHGARPVRNQHKPRLVLRYMLAQSLSGEPCVLDEVNKAIQGDLFPHTDDSAGAHAKPDGTWNLHDTDFTRMETDS